MTPHQAPQYPLPLPGTVTGGPGKITGGSQPVKLSAATPAEIDALANGIDYPDERRCRECHCLMLTTPGAICRSCDEQDHWW